MPDLLVVVDDVPKVISPGVVRLSHAHRVVGEVDLGHVSVSCGGTESLASCTYIAVVAEEFGHGCHG